MYLVFGEVSLLKCLIKIKKLFIGVIHLCINQTGLGGCFRGCSTLFLFKLSNKILHCHAV